MLIIMPMITIITMIIGRDDVYTKDGDEDDHGDDDVRSDYEGDNHDDDKCDVTAGDDVMIGNA